MLAIELAKILLEHPNYIVEVGCEGHLFGDFAYFMEPIEKKMIEVDESTQTIYLGEHH